MTTLSDNNISPRDFCVYLHGIIDTVNVIEGVTSLQFSQIREKLKKVDLSEPDTTHLVVKQTVDGSKLIDISKPIHGATL